MGQHWFVVTLPAESGSYFPEVQVTHVHEDESHHATERPATEPTKPTVGLEGRRCMDCGTVFTEGDEVRAPHTQAALQTSGA